MRIHTDPALSARRRPLKPLLSAVLAGEPWTVALIDPGAVPPAVLVACAVSYISRRHARWEGIPAVALGRVMGRAIQRDRAEIRPGDWPFLDALERLVPAARWHELEPMIEPYRVAGRGRQGVAHTPPPSCAESPVAPSPHARPYQRATDAQPVRR